MKKKYYVVIIGRVKAPSIYRSWENECFKVVHKYPGAIFKGFDNIDKAVAYLKERSKKVLGYSPIEIERLISSVLNELNNATKPIKLNHIKKSKMNTSNITRQLKSYTIEDFRIIKKRTQYGRVILKIKHLMRCNKEFLFPETVFYKNPLCLPCELKQIDSIEYLKKRIFSILGNEYIILNESLTKSIGNMLLQIKHLPCGQIREVKVRRFLKYQEPCPCITASQGEKKIASFLLQNNIEYNPQYIVRIGWSTHIFDFAVFNRNKLHCFIEFDGEQHYTLTDDFGGKKALNLTVKRDKAKDSYCIKNNIRLIRIPYWEINNIDTILKSDLKELMP